MAKNPVQLFTNCTPGSYQQLITFLFQTYYTEAIYLIADNHR